MLDRPIYVRAGAVLIVEPGTIVRAEGPTTTGISGQSPSDAGALIVCRGAKLVANGTAQSPIIFTSIDDPLLPCGDNTIPPWENPLAGAGSRDLTDPANRRQYQTADPGQPNAFEHSGLWGGVVLLGEAPVAQGNATGAQFIDNPGAIDTGTGCDYLRGLEGSAKGLYGGTDEGSDSGVMRFVSIRYAGARAWGAHRLAGLALAGVGSNTVVELVEVWNAAGNGFELRGGSARLARAAAWFAGQDAFAWDEGWHGLGQQWFAIQDNASDGTGRDPVAEAGDALLDGQGPEPDDMNPAGPYSVPLIYNATLIGRGTDSGNTAPGNGLRFRHNSGGRLRNSIVMDTAGPGLWIGTNALQEARLAATRSSGGEFNLAADSAAAPGPDLSFQGVHWWSIGATGACDAASVNGGANDAVVAPILGAGSNGNVFAENPGLRRIARLNERALNPLLAAGAGARSIALAAPWNGWFAPAAHAGAFRDGNWLSRWSMAAWCNVLTNAAPAAPPVVQLEGAPQGIAITFDAQVGVDYVVEHSTDGKTYRPIAAVTGAGAPETVVQTNGLAADSANLYRVLAQ